MIKVEIFRDSSNIISAFTVKGHAKAAPHGEDIVCAAVSAIVYTALGSLGDLADIENYTINEDGMVNWSMPEGVSLQNLGNAKIILETMFIGLKQISITPLYKKYISIVERGGAF